MFRLIARKLIIILILLPILNMAGFFYALVHPHLFAPGVNAAAVKLEEIVPWEAYRSYLQGVMSGDWGQVEQISVREVVMTPLQHSLILVTVALIFTIVTGLLLGFLSISPRTRRISPVAVVILAAGSSMPGFLLGGMILSLMVYRTLYAGARSTPLPLSGYGLGAELILPVLVLSIQPALHIAKITAGLLEYELQQDYIRVARAKGLSWFMLLWRHALPNMLASVVITMGEAMRLIVGTLVIVEAIFIWPGIGRIFLFTIGLRLDARPPGVFFGNPPLLAAIAAVFGALLLLADLLANLVAYAFDPRLRYGRNEKAWLN